MTPLSNVTLRTPTAVDNRPRLAGETRGLRGRGVPRRQGDVPQGCTALQGDQDGLSDLLGLEQGVSRLLGRGRGHDVHPQVADIAVGQGACQQDQAGGDRVQPLGAGGGHCMHTGVHKVRDADVCRWVGGMDGREGGG